MSARPRSSRFALACALSLGLPLGCGDDGSSDDGAATTSGTTTAPGSTGSTGAPPSESTGEPPAGSTSSGSTAADEGSTSDGASGEETSIPAVAFDEVLTLIGEECFCHRSAPPPEGST